jgi:hypothetical protein
MFPIPDKSLHRAVQQKVGTFSPFPTNIPIDLTDAGSGALWLLAANT